MKIILLILLILILIGLGLAGYLLISPIKLEINSRAGLLKLGWNRWMIAGIYEDSKNWYIHFQLWFWKKRYSIEELLFTQGKKEKETINEKTTKTKTQTTRFRWPSLLKIIRVIKVTKLKWSLDTNDFILNAYMAPALEMLNLKSGFNTHINFMGKNEIVLRAESRIIYMLKAGIF